MPSNPNPLERSRLAKRPPPFTDSPPLPAPRPPWMPSLARPKREVPTLRLDHILLAILLVNLLVLGAIAIKHLGITQSPQIICMVVAIAFGLVLGVTRARLRHVVVRIWWVVLGVGLAAAAWWFVPTIGGLN